jgi:hypothetical protein
VLVGVGDLEDWGLFLECCLSSALEAMSGFSFQVASEAAEGVQYLLTCSWTVKFKLGVRLFPFLALAELTGTCTDTLRTIVLGLENLAAFLFNSAIFATAFCKSTN